MVHLLVITTHQCSLFIDTSWECHRRNGCNGADSKALHGFKSRIVLYSTKPLLSRRCTTRRPKRPKPNLFIGWEYTHHTRMHQAGSKFCVKTTDDYLFSFVLSLFSVFVSKDLERWRAFSVFVSLLHLFILRSLDIFECLRPWALLESCWPVVRTGMLFWFEDCGYGPRENGNTIGRVVLSMLFLLLARFITGDCGAW